MSESDFAREHREWLQSFPPEETNPFSGKTYGEMLRNLKVGRENQEKFTGRDWGSKLIKVERR